MKALIEACAALQKEANANILFIISDEEELINDLISTFSELPIIVATSSKTIRANLEEKAKPIMIKKIAEFPKVNINILSKARELLLSACIENWLQIDAKVIW